MGIQNFKDLNAWQLGHQLVLLVYCLTRKFPVDERFGLIDQIRRCAVSVTSNIAEGFGRYSSNEKLHFYGISKGSLLEMESQMLISKDLGYISAKEYQEFSGQAVDVNKLISGLMKSAPTKVK